MSDNLIFKDLPMLARLVSEKVIGVICQQFGVENLGQLATEIQTLKTTVNRLNSDMAQMVDAKINAALVNPDRIKQIAMAVSREQRTYRDEQAEQRRADFRRILAESTGLQPNQLDSLLERADEAKLAAGKSPTEWPEAVGRWLEGQISEMQKTIAAMVNKTKAKNVDLQSHARYLVIQGIEPDDTAAVRRALEQDTTFDGLLKKA